MYFIVSNTGHRFLIDTGASVSLCQPHVAINKSLVSNTNPIAITGINSNPLFINEIYTIRPIENCSFTHDLYILPRDNNVQFDGIFGMDFIKKYQISINFCDKQLISPYKKIPLLCNDDIKGKQIKKDDVISKTVPEQCNVTIPSRNIFTLQISCEKPPGIYLCPKTKINEYLTLPESIVKVDNNNKFITTILNSSEDDEQLPNLELKLEPFDINVINNISSNEYVQNNANNSDRKLCIKENLRVSHLNQEESSLVTSLCFKYADIFHLEGDKLTFTSEIKHDIITTTNVPISSKSYRYPQIHKEEVKSQINKLLEQKIIQPSSSPWSSPVWIVPKKADASGKIKWRMVIDYRNLNEITIGDKYPLPNITDVLDQLGKCKYFTTLDLASGFHQIEVNPSDIPKTAFSVEFGHYEFLRMPFGLKNSPATFQRAVNNVLTGLQGEICLVYLDDIIIFSSDLQDHMTRLEKVFKRLQTNNLKLQPDKCEFLRKEVCYLGHVITPEGVKPNPEKIRAVTEFPQPKNQKQIKQFLGLSGYYRRFVPNYSKIIKPLTTLLKKDVEFNFNKQCVEAFETCKKLLTSSPILQYPDFTKPFILTTDASNVAIGAVLSQGELKRDLPVAYASRTLNAAENRYSTIEKELLAILWSTQHFRPYLYGREFIICTDHKPLTWLFSVKDPGSRLVRWRLKLQEYQYKIVYKPGITNQNADALSRIQVNLVRLDELTSNTEFSKEIAKIPVDYYKISHSDKSILNRDAKNILYMYADSTGPGNHRETNTTIENDLPVEINFDNNDYLSYPSISNPNRVYHIIKVPNKLDNLTCFKILSKLKNVLPEKTYHIWKNNNIHYPQILSHIFKTRSLKFVICHDRITIPPETDRIDIIKQFHISHDNYHKGINETCRKIQETFNWPHLRNQVEEVINGCEICQRAKINRKHIHVPLQLTSTPTKPFESICIDIFEIDKLKFLTIIDKFSKYVQCRKINANNSENVESELMSYFSQHPIPSKIHTDLGPEFLSHEFKQFCEYFNIRLTYSAADNPASNGAIERFHATLADSIRCYSLEHPNSSIEKGLPLIINSYNNSKNTSTQLTPYEILYGDRNLENNLIKDPSLNPEKIKQNYLLEIENWRKFLYKKVRNTQILNKEKVIARVNEGENPNTKFKVNDLVYVRQGGSKKHSNFKKEPKYTGPYMILKIPYANTATLRIGRRLFDINFSRLKPYSKLKENETNYDSDESTDNIPLARLAEKNKLTPGCSIAGSSGSGQSRVNE